MSARLAGLAAAGGLSLALAAPAAAAPVSLCGTLLDRARGGSATTQIRANRVACARARAVARLALRKCQRGGITEPLCNRTRSYPVAGLTCRQRRTTTFFLPVTCTRGDVRVRFSIALD